MKCNPQSHPSSAEDQAALWAARLDGDTLDRRQRAELDAWLDQDPAHRALLSRYCQLSADLEERIPRLVAGGAVVLPPEVSSAGRSALRRFAVACAAAAAIAITVFLVRPSPGILNLATASVERSERTLPDGTKVELNANTSLRFDNSGAARRVRLAGGEALFIVEKDPTRPFIVETPGGVVAVTGTTFHVRSEAARQTLEVTVVEGSVSVRPGEVEGLEASQSLALRAGDQFSSRHPGVRSLSPGQIDDTLAWRRGLIVLHGAPLRDVAARFAHYHGRAINVSPSVAQELVGGTHRLDDLDGFLAGVALALPVVRQDDPSGTIVLRRRPGS